MIFIILSIIPIFIQWGIYCLISHNSIKQYIRLHLLPINKRKNSDAYNYIRNMVFIILGIYYTVLTIYLSIMYKDILWLWYLGISFSIEFIQNQFIIIPAVFATHSILGCAIYLFYIILKKPQEPFLQPSNLFSCINFLEFLFWSGFLYPGISNVLHNELLSVFIISAAYSLMKISAYAEEIKQNIIPYYTTTIHFITMVMTCMLFSISENMITPIVYYIIIIIHLNKIKYSKN